MRERLRPYIMAQMKLASVKGTPPMRPLFFDFPEDKNPPRWTINLCSVAELLVAPVLNSGVTKRKVYLPAGATWTDAWTGKKFKGGQTIAAAAPLEKIPLYLRDGRKLPVRA